ncbi:MAG: hypothetical protein IIB44_00180 [Candidatus Marinimicrobia bacterium]|nr:hypothetical protein [Candidatus Neomarinimicrobiota bacterium]MCH8067666.1 hypothetical protein [Candidatus Neomarinimicrobiota bacterium]
MISALLAVTGLICFLLGYCYYSKMIAKKIYNLGNDIVTPAYELRDDIDYLPTKRHIHFGHHYISIAGAAPIIGPCVAAFWG